MNLSNRKQVSEFIALQRLSAIIRTKDAMLARRAMQAAVDGGFRVLEFTLTTPDALLLIRDFRKQGFLVGAGTVLTAGQCREAVSAGAQFVVSPVCDPDVIAEAERQDVVCIPAGFTPSELQQAHLLGADFVKLFPAPAGGVDFVHSVLAPLPHLRLFPTAGITIDNFLDYLNAGCAGVGFVRALFEPADLAAGRFEAIKERAIAIMKRLTQWKERPAKSGLR